MSFSFAGISFLYYTFHYMKKKGKLNIILAFLFSVIIYLPANSQSLPASIFIGTIYNNYSSYTIDIIGSSGTNHFSPDTITIYSQDTVFWHNSSGTIHCVTCAMVDTGNLSAGATSQPFTNFSVGTTVYHCKTHGSSASGVIIVMPSPASATRWEFFSKEQSIQQQESIPMPSFPLEMASRKSNSRLHFGGSIEFSAVYRKNK